MESNSYSWTSLFFLKSSVYSSRCGSLHCGDIISETSKFTDKNGDLWIGHHRGWSMLYHAESNTYYMRKVDKNKSGSTQKKFEEEDKQLLNGKLTLNIFKEEETPGSILLEILENNGYSNDEKKEYFKKN